jgi:hypothetical protein
MESYHFNCGCSYPIRKDLGPNKTPLLDFKYEDIKDCPAIWDIFAKGLTLGVFQLESNLGQKYCKELKPTKLEHLEALTSILRPGCIGGDTKIIEKIYDSNSRKLRCNTIKIRDLFNKFNKNHFLYGNSISSCNESNVELFNNTIKQVFFNGIKKIFRPKVQLRHRNCTNHTKYYNLECTEDHRLLTLNGWQSLCDIKIGTRIAALDVTKGQGRRNYKTIAGERNFHDICFYHYEYRCVFCDWKEGSLDTNHIDGNRKTNNNPNNLCFLCPNHHRLYTEGKINKEQLILAREKYAFKKSEYITWVQFNGYDYIGEKDVYDIEVEGPNHNYIAGGIVVHNCLNSKTEDGKKNLTQQYCDRKNGKEKVVYNIPALEPILNETYGVMCYQEQQIAIAQNICGFTASEGDSLRKSVGKKDAKLLLSLEEKFINGAEKVNKVSKQEAIQIFDWIKSAARYVFNRSHSNLYGLRALQEAYLKTHFPLAFYTAKMSSPRNSKTQEDVANLIYEARRFNIQTKLPDLRDLQPTFYHDNESIYFGLVDIKKFGGSSYTRLVQVISEHGEILANFFEFCMNATRYLTPSVVELLIKSGSCDFFKISRTQMLEEYRLVGQLTAPQQELLFRHYDAQKAGIFNKE